MKRIALALVTLSVAAFALAGCNTMAGFGQDVQDAGSSIHKSADKHK